MPSPTAEGGVCQDVVFVRHSSRYWPSSARGPCRLKGPVVATETEDPASSRPFPNKPGQRRETRVDKRNSSGRV